MLKGSDNQIGGLTGTLKSDAFKEGTTYQLNLHQYGDLSQSCTNTGEPYNPLNAEFDDGNSGGYFGNLGTFTADGSNEFNLQL